MRVTCHLPGSLPPHYQKGIVAVARSGQGRPGASGGTSVLRALPFFVIPGAGALSLFVTLVAPPLFVISPGTLPFTRGFQVPSTLPKEVRFRAADFRFCGKVEGA